MRVARILVNGIYAGNLEEISNHHYRFYYHPHYQGMPVSLTMPINQTIYEFKHFPPFFEGLLPEGIQLEAILRKYKLDKQDYFGQLLVVGKDCVGAVTIEEML